VTVAYSERIPFPDQPSPRLWRGPIRIVLAAWGGALSGFILGIGLDLPALVGIAIGVAVAAAVVALPVSRSRRGEVRIEVAEGELRWWQGARPRRVPLSDIRRVEVLTATGQGRRTAGYGPVFGRGFRWTWDVPDPSLGVVRIDRGRGGLDVDVATARPDDLARALRTPGDR
jgi:hypothetical protein